MKIRELYQDKNNRDTRYKELKSQGKDVSRGTTGPQYIHPKYIEDFAGPEKLDIGLGNTVYKTYFKNLYIVKEN